VRIDPQISPMPLPAFRLVADHCADPAVRRSRAACEQKVVSPDRCDCYERCAPGSMLYADYLEKQNLRPPDPPPDRQSSNPPAPDAPAQAAKQKPRPVDTGLAPKLGDIPTDSPATGQLHRRVVTAYQVQRYAPTGALVDVTI
jgi:hypothetical protein